MSYFARLAVVPLGLAVLAACHRAPAPVVANAPPSAAAAAPTPVRAIALFDHPEWIGRAIAVDVFEVMLDSAHSTVAAAGEYDIEVKDAGTRRLVLAAASSAGERAAGGLSALPAALVSPVRVTGTLARTAVGLRLVAHAVEPIAFPTPAPVPRLAEVVARPIGWNARYVEVIDDHYVGAEMSRLGSDFWLATYPGAKQTCKPVWQSVAPPGRADFARVRAVGFVYTTGRRGHMGHYRGELVATELHWIDPARPECR